MNWHEIKDERSYEMNQVIARILRESPEKLALVKASSANAIWASAAWRLCDEGP